MLDMPIELEEGEKAPHRHQLDSLDEACTGSQTSPSISRLCTGTDSQTSGWAGASRARFQSGELQALEQNLNSKLETLTEYVQNSWLEAGQHFGALHEQMRNMSEQISEVQRALAATNTPPSSQSFESSLQSSGSYQFDMHGNGHGTSEPLHVLHDGTRHGDGHDMSQPSGQSSCLQILQEMVGRQMVEPRSFTLLSQSSLGSDADDDDDDDDGPDASRFSLGLHAGQKRDFKTPSCPVFQSSVQEQSAEQGRRPPQANPSGKLFSSSSSSPGKKIKKHAAMDIFRAEVPAEVPSGQSDSFAFPSNRSHVGDGSHPSRRSSHPVHVSLPCLPTLWERVNEPSADCSPYRAITLGNLPSWTGEVQNQHSLSVDHVEQVADRAPCKHSHQLSCGSERSHVSCVEGGLPDTWPLRAGQKSRIMSSPCLPDLQEPVEKQNADRGPRHRPSSTLGELPSLSKKIEKLGISRAEVAERLKRSVFFPLKTTSSSNSQDARRALYRALPSEDSERPVASCLPGQPCAEDGKGPAEAGQQHVGSLEVRVHDGSIASARQQEHLQPRPQIFGVQSVLPGEMQGSRSREMQCLGERFFRDMAEQDNEQVGAHDPGSLLGLPCEWQGCVFPGSFLVRLRARFQATGNGVVVLLTYLSGQDSSTSRCWICRTLVIILAASASLATRLPIDSRHNFYLECMPPTKSGFALRLGALISLLVWAFLRRSQRMSCREKLVQALCQTGLDCDFEAASRWDAACASIYWILILTLKLSLPALEGESCAPHTHLEEAVSTVGFMVSAGVLLSAVFALTQILRMLELVIKDYPCWAVRSNDLPEALKQWRIRHCAIRGMCWSYEFQSWTLLIVLGTVGAFALVEFSNKASTRLLPEAMIACSLLFVTWRAASVTQACRRIIVILSTTSFVEDPAGDRMSILMDCIEKSKAGFYVSGVRISPELVLKVINATAVISFATLSRFSPMFKLP